MDLRFSLRNPDNIRFKLEKYVEGAWVHTASSPGMEGCSGHARAVGGQVRATNRHGKIVGEWLHGKPVPTIEQPRESV